MKIAVTFENGEVFQHFGHTEQFKVYTVSDEKITDTEVVSTNGQGHSALADFLFQDGIDVLICGGIGQGAQTALSDAGIEVVSGATGDADKAVIAYLAGELESAGTNCDHHDENHSCGEHDCASEGGCAGCSGCHSESNITGPNVGKICKTHYKGTFNDGTQFDSSYDRGKPLEFICGAGMMIEGFDKAVANMKVGDTVNIHLMPEEAYGEADPEAIFTIELNEMPGAEELNVGEQVYLSNGYGQQFPVKVIDKTDTSITFDANHEMAGKELNFTIELIEVV